MPDIRIGVVDSGHHPEQRVYASSAFVLQDNQLWQQPAEPDQSGHGSRVIDVIHSLAPAAALLSAQVMQQHQTSAVQVAAAIQWLVAEGVELINLSLGLSLDRPVLCQACDEALAAGVILVAASPAQGNPVYPATYPGVIRATGDARCEHNQWVWLDSRQADVGACVRPLDNRIGTSGASMGCAHVSGHLAAWLIRGPHNGHHNAMLWLQQQADFYGVEQKGIQHA